MARQQYATAAKGTYTGVESQGKAMTNRIPLPPPGFDDLPVEDQVEYVQSLWDRIAAKPDRVPFPEWHRQVLDQRLAAREANAEVARPWAEVRDEIRSKLGSGSTR